MSELNAAPLSDAENFNKFVPNVEFTLIPIKDLVSNQEYQRNLSINHVRKAAEHFDLCQINPVKVSRRNGVNYVFNGQHTIEIIALVSGSRETPVWCMVYEDLEYAQEADIFANQLKYTKPLVPYEIFMANIEAGNDKQLIIRDLVESYRLRIVPGKQVGGICAIATLEEIYDKYGFHILDKVLRLLIATWEGDVNSFSSNMLKGLARLLWAYGDDLKEDIFKDKLGRCSVKEIHRISKERRAGSLGFAEAMLINYNKKLKQPLRWTPLYNGLKHTTKSLDYERELQEELELAEEYDDSPSMFDQIYRDSDDMNEIDEYGDNDEELSESENYYREFLR